MPVNPPTYAAKNIAAQLLLLSEACVIAGCQEDTLRARVNSGAYPSPIPLNGRVMIFLRDEFTAAVEQFNALRAMLYPPRQRRYDRPGRPPVNPPVTASTAEG